MSKDKPAKIVEHRLLHCPACNGVKLRTYATKKDGFGDLTRYTRCKNVDCKFRFVVLIIDD